MPEISMNDLFFYEPAWGRLREQVQCDDRAGAPLLLDREGRLTRDGAPATIGPGAASVVWASPDTNLDGHINALLDHALCAKVKWLQAGTAGIDNPRFAKLNAAGVRLTTSDAMVPSIAELVMACVLDHYQRGPERRWVQSSHNWTRLPFREIAGTRWLVVGFGAIGRELGSRARAFQVHITGVRRSVEEDPAADRIISPDSLALELGRADVVVLALPLSAATRNIADSAFFAAMKKGAVIVNVGRGGLLDEAALVAALNGGHLGHAILDTVVQEPLRTNSLLWDHPKVVLTCHVGGMGDGLMARSDALFLENLMRYREGRPLRRVADQSLLITT